MSWYQVESPPALVSQYGARALFEQYGNEALNAPVNTEFRFPDGYNPALARLLVFRNGVLQDITGGDYTEPDSRTIQMAVALINFDRLLGLEIFRDIGQGGLKSVDRPPAGAGVGPYTVTQPFAFGRELLVWLNGILQFEHALEDYQITLPNQFTFNAAIPPASVIVAANISTGQQGIKYRENYRNLGPFPANIATVNTLDNDLETVLVFLNGQLQAINFDYIITGPNTIRITRVVPGAVNEVQIIGLAASHPPQWRA